MKLSDCYVLYIYVKAVSEAFSTVVVSTKLGCAGTCMLVSSDCTSCCLSSCTKESSCCCGAFTMGGCVQHWLDKLNASDKILDHHVEYCH